MNIKMTYFFLIFLMSVSCVMLASVGARPHSKTEEVIEQSSGPGVSSRNSRAVSLPNNNSNFVRQMAQQLEGKIHLPAVDGQSGASSSAVLTQNPLRQNGLYAGQQNRRLRVTQMDRTEQSQVELPVIRRSSSATKTAVQLAQTQVALVQASARDSKDVVVTVVDDKPQVGKAQSFQKSKRTIWCCKRKKKVVIDERATEEALLADLQADEKATDPQELLQLYRKSLAGSLLLNVQLRSELKEAIEERKTLNQSNRLKTLMKAAAVAAIIVDRANAYWPAIVYAAHYIGL